MGSFSSSLKIHLLVTFSISLMSFFPTCFTDSLPLKVVDIENPVVEFTPSSLPQYSSSHVSKDLSFCERVGLRGKSRLKLESYASSSRVRLVPSDVLPERLHNKILVCIHMNASLGLCQCEQHEWKSVQNGLWSSVLSPYKVAYVDVMVKREVPCSVTLSIDEEFHQWRLYCLALGFVVLLLAPIVSRWIPFYYGSSMVIGVVLVILILLFQGMKLLPGRKNFFYLLMTGPLLGIGSLIVYYFSMMVSSIVVNFGLSQEAHHLVSLFALLGIVLSGAGLGYWMVRKFVISSDGSVEIGVAQFVKWAMRIISAALFTQSSFDFVLAAVAFFSSWIICVLILKWQYLFDGGKKSPWWSYGGNRSIKPNRTEFRSRTPKTDKRRPVLNTSKTPCTTWFSQSPFPGVNSAKSVPHGEGDYYSTFHKTPTPKKLSRKEWDDSKRTQTREALRDLSSTPEFVDWMINNADKIKLRHDSSTSSSGGSIQSGSDSTEENISESANRLSLWKW